MSIEMIVGEVDTVQHSTEVQGSVGGSGGIVLGSHQSTGVMNFRIDGKPVQLKLKNAISLSGGDKVGVAGKVKNGTLHATAIYNETTKALDSQPSTLLLVVGIFNLIFGLPTSILLFGIFFVLLGVLLTYKGYVNTKAKKMLEEKFGLSPSNKAVLQ